jgi:hypothetical protein
MMTASTQHSEAMNSLLKSAKYSDLTIVCKGQEFPVHRAIICPRSTFFDLACSSGFKESYSGRIELEDDPATVERMISYMYTFDYRDEEHRDHRDLCLESSICNIPSRYESHEHRNIIHQEKDQPALLSSVRVYAIADKYDIPSLKRLAKERFESWAKKNWAREDFSDIVREIFESTPTSDRGLRDIVIRIVALHADVLTKKDEFRRLIEEDGDLGLSTLCQLLETHSEEKAGLRSRIGQLETNTATLEQQLQQCRRNLNHRVEEIDATIKKLNRLGECRQCGRNANIFMNVETSYNGREISVIRCKGCRTRHYV